MVNNVEEKVYPSSASSLVFFLCQGCFLGIATSNIFREAKTSTPLAVIIGIIVSIIPLLLIMYILKNTKGEGIVDTINIIFGNNVGKIINFIISIVCGFIASFILYNFISFIDVEYMPETSKIFIACFLFIMFSYILSKGIVSICKSSQILFYINIVPIALTIIGITSNVDFSNLFPIFEGGTAGILKGSLIYAVFAAFPIFLVTLVGKSIVTDEKKYKKSIIIYYIIGCLNILLLTVLALLSLGINIISLIKYPEYNLLTQIKIFYIFERVQNIFAIQFCFNIIITSLMCMMYILKTFEKTFNKEKVTKISSIVIPLIICIASLKIFPNVTVANTFYMNIFPYLLSAVIGSFVLIIFFRILYLKMKKKY